ncbi:hypothetical protein [Streptomyces luteireticuli]|uniref:Sulfotransferase family protein n=1 Tax=Streptomyces luteireticuli TaxID=173858 RepID=A0ABN0YX69_9ACTN
MDVTGGHLPVALDLPGRRIALRPLARSDFHEPWFDYAYRNEGEQPAVQRPLEDLLDWAEGQPSRLFRLIAHTTRCGSTLLANHLSLRPDTLVLKEPVFLLDAALHALRARDATERRAAHRLLRALLAYCDATAEAHGRRLVVKLTSWTSLVVLDALGGIGGPARWLLVWREPAEVVASLEASPPSWRGLRDDPALRAALGLAADPGGEGDIAFHAGLWRALVEPFVGAVRDAPVRLLDYVTLAADPAGALLAAERWLGLAGTADLPGGFAAACGRYAKSADGEPFDPTGTHRRPALTPAGRAAVRRITDPALALVRTGAPLVTAEAATEGGRPR